MYEEVEGRKVEELDEWSYAGMHSNDLRRGRECLEEREREREKFSVKS